MRRLGRLALGLAVVAAGGELALAWKASTRAMHPPPARAPWSLADYPQLAPEEVAVTGANGLRLQGRFFAGRTRATIVVTHGYSADQNEMLPLVDALHRAGFSAFTYDMRGSGRTGGASTLGTLEREDLRAVVAAVAARDDVDPARIGAFGFSLGGAVTLMEAAGDERVRAVVADSAWSDVDHWLKPRLADLVLHPNTTFTPVSLALVEQRSDASLGELHPRRDVARLSPRPLLLVHGEADGAVPSHDSEINFAAAREPKQLWLIPGAEHGDTLRPGGAATSERVIDFFRQALLD